MPKTLATALCPTAAAQIVATVRPSPVANAMIAIGAPTAPAGTYPTSASARATEPATNTGMPSAPGFPAKKAFSAGAAGAGAAAGAAAGAPGADRAPRPRCSGVTLPAVMMSPRDEWPGAQPGRCVSDAPAATTAQHA